MQVATDVLDRFWSKVYRSPNCWFWLAADNGYGYGAFALPGRRTVKAHRFAYELLVGPIPEGLTLDHLCRNRACVNPAHLEPVTRGENVRRGDLRFNNGRWAWTSCPKGHPYTPENLYTARGRRECRTCQRAASRRAAAKRKARLS